MNNYINHVVTTKPKHLISEATRALANGTFESNQESNKAIARILFNLDNKIPSSGLTLEPLDYNNPGNVLR
jgi:hypothetical protein